MDVVFKEPDGDVWIAARDGETILETALRGGLPHFHLCGGLARCTTCRVLVADGVECLAPRNIAEADVAEGRGWDATIRLACQTDVTGSLVVRRLVVDDVDADLISTDPELAAVPANDGTETTLAVLFCDVADFTGFSAGQLPHDVVHMLNRYYRDVGEAVLGNRGRIDKYMGDGMMALFDADGGSLREACLDAVRAGVMIVEAMKALDRYSTQHFGWRFGLRVGIDVGPVVMGNIGHPEFRPITAIGETVTTAERLQAKAKELGASLLVSGRVADTLGPALVAARTVETDLRGYAGTITVVEVADVAERDPIFHLQTSAARLLVKGERFVSAFYGHLFRLAPATTVLFEDGVQGTQRRMLLNVLRTAVRGARRMDDLAAVVADLGRRHAGYGVLAAHFPVAGQALELALEDVLGAALTPQERAAWKALYDDISTRMIAAMPPAESRP